MRAGIFHIPTHNKVMAENKELTPEEVKALLADKAKLEKELAASKDLLAKNEQLIKELNEQLASSEKEKDGLSKYPVLTHKGKKYELVDAKSRARFEGENVLITKESLESNPKLLEYCIKKGFECLREKGGK